MRIFIIVIGIALVLAIFALVKIKYIKHKLSWIIILIGILFIYVTFMASTVDKNVNLNTLEGIEIASKIYFNWLGNSFSNFKTLTTHAIKMDWNTNFTFSK